MDSGSFSGPGGGTQARNWPMLSSKRHATGRIALSMLQWPTVSCNARVWDHLGDTYRVVLHFLTLQLLYIPIVSNICPNYNFICPVPSCVNPIWRHFSTQSCRWTSKTMKSPAESTSINVILRPGDPNPLPPLQILMDLHVCGWGRYAVSRDRWTSSCKLSKQASKENTWGIWEVLESCWTKQPPV